MASPPGQLVGGTGTPINLLVTDTPPAPKPIAFESIELVGDEAAINLRAASDSS